MLTMSDVLEFFKFLLAAGGLSSLAVVFSNDFVISLKNKSGYYAGLTRPLARKPFTCALCMGFYLSPIAHWLVYNSLNWREYVIAVLAGSSFSWLFHRIVTGDS